MGISFRASLKIISLTLGSLNMRMENFMRVSLRMGIGMGWGVIEIFMGSLFVRGIGIMITSFRQGNDMSKK